MKIGAGVVGATAGPRAHDIDARWLMAYAAGLGDTAPERFDTLRREGLAAHPLFPVCYEWPLAVALRARTMTEEIAIRGVHATHDLVIHRPPRAGDRLSTTATVVAVEARSPGAYVVMRFDTVDARGQAVTTTQYGSLYLGVACESAGSPPRSPATAEGLGGATIRPREAPLWTAAVAIPAGLAHVYTECARIWNPIHTDVAVARAAGLPDIILHGTANLALAVSRVLAREPEGPGARVTRVACRFGGMVRLPSTLTVRGLGVARGPDGRRVAFDALAADGRPAVRDAAIWLGDGAG